MEEKFTEKQIKDINNILLLATMSSDQNIKIAIARAGFYMDNLINDKDPFVRRAIVDNGYRLKMFLFDDDSMVREGVAIQGYGLDFLIHDKELKVRIAAAKSSKLNRNQINELVKDKDPAVRVELAKRGEKLSKLYNDPSYLVRLEVAKHGYKLPELSKDKNDIVRAEVASQGYNIKKLIDDESEIVRKAAYLYALHNDNAISEWKKTSRGYTCGCCGYYLEKGKTATKRCPKCNFILTNFEKVPFITKKRN